MTNNFSLKYNINNTYSFTWNNMRNTYILYPVRGRVNPMLLPKLKFKKLNEQET